ncbi:MAG: dihydrolipoamide acetyltransferase family protein [Thermoplasmata archaeon]|jgi:pyruvate dehydrogenase E2 component (dihydrolipoyllysine-residue acetyltransferase)
MAFEFRLPDIGEGVAEGEVVRWFVKPGDTIKEDDPLVSVLTDKANVEIPSPKSGRILGLHAQVGEKVKVGGLLVTIEVSGGGTAASAPPPTKSSTVAVSPPTPSSPTPSAAPSPAPAAAPSSVVLATPFVRRRALELGVDLAQVKGTGPGGRILDTDLEAAKSRPPGATSSPEWPALSSSTEPARHALPPEAPTPPAVSEGVLERIPIRGIRRVIAEHMSESKHKAAHFTYVEEVDVTELILLRDRMAKHVEKQGVRLSYLPFIVKAVVAGLKAHPKLNATMDDAREELVVRSDYNIGIATAAPEGLIVPVVRHADRKSVVALAKEIQELSERGRAGKLSRTELTGSTFTITSLGALGGLLATPILNYPEVAILGVHKIQRRPVYRPDGSIGPADIMNLSISLDHRVVDGFEGAQFLAKVKAYLEDPHQLFAELA